MARDENRSQMVTHVRFKREQGGEWESGVAVGPDLGEVDAIVTYKGEVVPQPIWDYTREVYLGLMLFDSRYAT